MGKKGGASSFSFGVYFPKSSAQIQPRPPDLTQQLLRQVEELRDRESRLQTELLQLKLFKESAEIVPFLESEISTKTDQIKTHADKIQCLESENERLNQEIKNLRAENEEERIKNKKNSDEFSSLESSVSEANQVTAELEAEIRKLKEEFTERNKTACFSKNLKQRTLKSADILVSNLKLEVVDRNQKEQTEIEAAKHFLSKSVEDLCESASSPSKQAARGVARVPKPPPKPTSSTATTATSISSSSSASTCVPPPPPPPPPRRSSAPPSPTATQSTSSCSVSSSAFPAPPPPPPMSKATSSAPPLPSMEKSVPQPPLPPPLRGGKGTGAKVKRVPEVVELYHTLMRRDSRRDSGVIGVGSETPATTTTANTRDMIGEIENRSAHLIAIKTDVETQGDFIRFLIKEVQNASFTNIEDVVAFVKWLDEELSYLVDERAVLKHFDWPEHKADALREAAFGYSDLKKLEADTSSFHDDLRQPCGPALKKMQSLLEKLEQSAYDLSRLRETSTKKFKGFHIPTEWMLETGIISQIKLASVKLAMRYMRRVSAGLQIGNVCPEQEELTLQGVRFAFRVHQFAGGFDAETMRAFEELRRKART